MNGSTTAGKAIFLAAIAALGISCLMRGNVIPALEPATLPYASRTVAGWITGLALLAAAAVAVPRATARYGLGAIAVVFLLWVLLLHAPQLAAHPRSGNYWTGAFETFAIGSAALVLFGLAPPTPRVRAGGNVLAKRAVRAGRMGYAVSLPVFGLLHFLFIGYVASVIPGWIPAHTAFGYATGSAHIAGGVSIATGQLARVAAYCVAAMFGSWVIILHAPRVLAHPHAANEWTSLIIALAMCGGALAIAGSLPSVERRGAGDTSENDK